MSTTEDGPLAGHGITVVTGLSPQASGRIWDFEAEYDPRDGWSAVTAIRRVYNRESETRFVEKGVVDAVTRLDPGIDPGALDPGMTVEDGYGDEYRVVVAPWERDYDSMALAYNLDGPSNVCEKLAPGEVVNRD